VFIVLFSLSISPPYRKEKRNSDTFHKKTGQNTLPEIPALIISYSKAKIAR
jgi:hypothetical protein